MRSQSTRGTVDGILAAVTIITFALCGIMWKYYAVTSGLPEEFGMLNPYAPYLIAGNGIGYAAYRMVVLGAVVGVFVRFKASLLLGVSALLGILNVYAWTLQMLHEGTIPNPHPQVVVFSFATFVIATIVIFTSIPMLRNHLLDREVEMNHEAPDSILHRVTLHLGLAVFALLGLTAVNASFIGIAVLFI